MQRVNIFVAQKFIDNLGYQRLRPNYKGIDPRQS